MSTFHNNLYGLTKFITSVPVTKVNGYPNTTKPDKNVQLTYTDVDAAPTYHGLHVDDTDDFGNSVCVTSFNSKTGNVTGVSKITMNGSPLTPDANGNIDLGNIEVSPTPVSYPVTSVNSFTGAVTLGYEDVGAAPYNHVLDEDAHVSSESCVISFNGSKGAITGVSTIGGMFGHHAVTITQDGSLVEATNDHNINLGYHFSIVKLNGSTYNANATTSKTNSVDLGYLVRSITLNGAKEEADLGNDGDVNIGYALKKITFNSTSIYEAGAGNNGVVNFGNIVTSVIANGSTQSINAGVITLPYFVKSVAMNGTTTAAVNTNGGALDFGSVIKGIVMNGTTLSGTKDNGGIVTLSSAVSSIGGCTGDVTVSINDTAQSGSGSSLSLGYLLRAVTINAGHSASSFRHVLGAGNKTSTTGIEAKGIAAFTLNGENIPYQTEVASSHADYSKNSWSIKKAITEHTSDINVHVTSASKTSWDGAASNASSALSAINGHIGDSTHVSSTSCVTGIKGSNNSTYSKGNVSLGGADLLVGGTGTYKSDTIPAAIENLNTKIQYSRRIVRSSVYSGSSSITLKWPDNTAPLAEEEVVRITLSASCTVKFEANSVNGKSTLGKKWILHVTGVSGNGQYLIHNGTYLLYPDDTSDGSIYELTFTNYNGTWECVNVMAILSRGNA